MKRWAAFIFTMTVFLISALFSCLEDDGSFEGDSLAPLAGNQNNSDWIITGYKSFLESSDFDTLSQSPDWMDEGNQILAAFGSSVSFAGDVNGDGDDDREGDNWGIDGDVSGGNSSSCCG